MTLSGGQLRHRGVDLVELPQAAVELAVEAAYPSPMHAANTDRATHTGLATAPRM